MEVRCFMGLSSLKKLFASLDIQEERKFVQHFIHTKQDELLTFRR